MIGLCLLLCAVIPYEDRHLPPIQYIDTIDHNTVYDIEKALGHTRLRERFKQTIAWKYYPDYTVPIVTWWHWEHRKPILSGRGYVYWNEETICVAKHWVSSMSISVDPEVENRTIVPITERESNKPWLVVRKMCYQDASHTRE